MDYPPLTYQDPVTHKIEGFSIEMAEILANKLEVDVEFVRTTWGNLSADLADGKFDIAMGGISDTPERSADFLVSVNELTGLGKNPLVRCSDQARYTSIESINQPNVRVIENRGGTNEQFVNEYLPNAQVTIIDDNLATFNQLINDDADVMITDNIEAVYRAKLNPDILCAVNPDMPFTEFTKVYLFQKDDVDLKDYVNDWLSDFTNTQGFEKLRYEYLGI